jgi:uncharacterized membrane protein YfcA
MSVFEGVIYVLGGFAAGIINTLAGNGSVITLPLLMAFGMPPNEANATNRLGILPQALSSVLSLKKSKRTLKLFRDGSWFFIPIILGSLIGAFLAVDVNPVVLKRIIAGVMLFVLFTLIYNPDKWLIATEVSRNRKTPLNFLAFLGIGIYGGFIQMGIGILLLTALVLVAKYSLRDGNVIKLLIALVLIIPSFLVFFASGQIEWLPGLAIALGSSTGAWFAVRYLLVLPQARKIIRWLLIGLLVVAIVYMLG